VLTFGIALGLLLGVASALQLLTRPGDRAPLA
jgi:hypothetical protein